MSGFVAVGYFLISIFFGLIIFSLWLRIFFRYVRISPLNQFCQLVHTVTNPLVNPVMRLLKLKYKPGQKYDWVAFGVLCFVELVKIICLSLLIYHAIIPFAYLLLYLAADLIIQPCDLLFYAILIRVIMSYVNPGWRHPIADFLRMSTEPLLRTGRRLVPDISGFDFSPFVIMIILKVITLFIGNSLPWRLF